MISFFLAFLDQRLSKRTRSRVGYLIVPERKPLDLRLLDMIPGRVADDGIKASFRLDVLPIAPNPGKAASQCRKFSRLASEEAWSHNS